MMAFKIKFSVFLLILIFSAVYCKTHEKITSSAIFGPAEEVPITNLPPNTCKIIAQIQYIHTISLSYKSDEPCSKTPCTASIKVLKINGYGSSFPVIASGDTLVLNFHYTLTPSKKLFPGASSLPPALKIADVFEGLVTTKLNMDKQTYFISSYNKIR